MAALGTYGWSRWGDPLAVVHALWAWQRDLTAPWDSVVWAVRFAREDLGPGVLLGLAVAIERPAGERVWLPVAGALLALHLALFSRWWFVF